MTASRSQKAPCIKLNYAGSNAGSQGTQEHAMFERYSENGVDPTTIHVWDLSEFLSFVQMLKIIVRYGKNVSKMKFSGDWLRAGQKLSVRF